jgi:hypothetical protein
LLYCLRSEDAGTYTCKAVNIAGEDSVNMDLIVQGMFCRFRVNMDLIVQGMFCRFRVNMDLIVQGMFCRFRVNMDLIVQGMFCRFRVNMDLIVQGMFFRFRVMVLDTIFNNISVISWRSVLLVEETGVPVENHQPVASH